MMLLYVCSLSTLNICVSCRVASNESTEWLIDHWMYDTVRAEDTVCIWASTTAAVQVESGLTSCDVLATRCL